MRKAIEVRNPLSLDPSAHFYPLRWDDAALNQGDLESDGPMRVRTLGESGKKFVEILVPDCEVTVDDFWKLREPRELYDSCVACLVLQGELCVGEPDAEGTQVLTPGHILLADLFDAMDRETPIPTYMSADCRILLVSFGAKGEVDESDPLIVPYSKYFQVLPKTDGHRRNRSGERGRGVWCFPPPPINDQVAAIYKAKRCPTALKEQNRDGGCFAMLLGNEGKAEFANRKLCHGQMIVMGPRVQYECQFEEHSTVLFVDIGDNWPSV